MKLFSIDECVELFGNEYEVVAISPCVYPNLSWYKGMSYSYASDIKKNFDGFRHLLLSVDFRDFKREEQKNRNLLKDLIEFRKCIKDYRNTKDDVVLNRIVEILKCIFANNKDLGDAFSASIEECISALSDKESLNVNKISEMRNLKNAWSRGMQYVSLRKRGD